MASRSSRASGPLAVVIACVAMAVSVYSPLGAQTAAPPGSRSSEGVSVAIEGLGSRAVAVLPFRNVTGEAADEWLRQGIAETVATDLQQYSTLTVVAWYTPAAARSYLLGDAADLTSALDAARAHGIAWVLAGGVQRLGSQVRITARIIDVAQGEAIEAVRVDGEIDDLFALQDRIVEGLAPRVAQIAGVSPPESRPPLDDVPTPPARPPSPDLPRAPQLAERLAPPETPDDVTAVIEVGGAPARAGFAVNAGALTGRPTVRPPRVAEPPILDARLDDTVWGDAAVITDFVQRQPLDGAPATELTEVFVAYDSANLYVAVYAHYSDPSMMRANRADRDRPIADDTFLVYIDPFLDQQRAYVFGVNAYGVQTDAVFNSGPGGGGGGARGGNFSPGQGGFGPGRGGPGGAPRGDDSWDALFDTAGRPVEDGFIVEIAIPFKSLRYPRRGGDAPHQWGFQLARTIRGKDESVVWSPVTRGVAGFLPQMGVMEGMTGLSTSRNLEILPTFTAIQFGSLDDSGAFVNADPEPEAGVNIKYGVTSNLTADFTFNPDFSQIESDQPQIEVNQRFDLFFPELRPFFLEGAEIFNFRGPVNLVHTRTIVDPTYGAKLTGKAGDTSIGVMFANDEAAGDLADTTDPRYAGQAATTFVSRVRYDLYSESYIGGIFTDRELLDSYNRVAGIDSNFRVGDTHSFGLRVAGSKTRDVDGVETTGHMINANLRKSGRNLSYNAAWYDITPDFDTDVGFLQRTDQRWLFGNVAYLWWPESWLISWGPQFTYARGFDFDGVLNDEAATAGVAFDFAKNIRTNFNVSSILERFGGIDFQKTRFNTFTTVSTSTRYAFGLGYNGGDQIFFDKENPYLGNDWGLNIFVNARVFPRLNSNININTNRFTDPRRGDALVFDVKILRALTTYQFTDRFLMRNITEFNTFDETVGLNFLFTYRVNAGTVFFAGYDDRYQQADRIERDLDGDGIDDRLFQTTTTKRTNRAFFLKFQYLFRV